MPVELHDQQLKQLENRFLECFQEHDIASRSEESVKNKRTLPVKALNEVLNNLADCIYCIIKHISLRYLLAKLSLLEYPTMSLL